MISARTCLECGKTFTPEDYRVRVCSDACRTERRRRTQRIYDESHKSIPKRTIEVTRLLDDHIREAREAGLSYAEWQMRQTLAMIPKVIV